MDIIGKLEIPENEILKYQTVEDFFTDNDKVLLISKNGSIDFSLVTKIIKETNNKPNLYGILVKKPKEVKWGLKYIGQRKSKYIRDRLRQHLYKKHKKTGAQLEKINIELAKGNDIGIKLFSIRPDELRQFYEQKLLNNIETHWNKQK